MPWLALAALRIGPIDKADGIRRMRARVAARALLATIYLAAGIFHLAIPDTFLMITPDWVPFPRETILATGGCEIAGAIALMTTRFRRAAGYALALYAVCVFPANIKHAFGDLPAGAVHLGWWYHAPRLAFQPVLVWWALFAGDIIDWPFARGPNGES